jgi:hypothetical protein
MTAPDLRRIRREEENEGRRREFTSKQALVLALRHEKKEGLFSLEGVLLCLSRVTVTVVGHGLTAYSDARLNCCVSGASSILSDFLSSS